MTPQRAASPGSAWAAVFVVAALATGIAACGRDDAAATPPAAAVPAPELSQVEPQVAAAVATAQRAAAARPTAATWGRLGMVLAAHDLRQEAVVCYREAAQLAPIDPQWPYLAALALRPIDLTAAVAEFRRAAELRPRHAAFYVQYGDTLLDHGDAAAARDQYERARELEPGSAWALFGLGRTALVAGDLAAARQHLAAAVVAKPDFREGHSLLAQVLQRLGQPEEAELHAWTAGNYPESSAPPDPVYQQVVDAGVSSIWAARRGLAHARAGRYAEAEREFRRVLEVSAGNARDYANLGAALAGQERFDEAVAAYRRALDLDPEEVSARNNLAQTLIAQGELERAAEQLDGALAVDPLDVEALLNLGIVRARQGRSDEAFARYREALRVAPGDLRVLGQLGQALALNGDVAGATELWRRALRIAPGQLETLYNLARARAAAGDHGEAIALLRQGMTRAPNSSRLALFLAWELAAAPRAELRNGEEAVRLASRVRRSYPREPQAADVLAAALAESGDFAGAVREAEAAIALAEATSARAPEQGKTLPELRERLARYRSGRPFRL